MLESALGFLLFLLIFGGGIELLRFAYYAVGLQLVVTNGVRASSIGGCSGGVTTCTPELSANQVKQRIVTEAAAYGIRIEPDSICIRAQSDLNCRSGEDTIGKSRELVVVRATQRGYSFFGLGELTVHASALARNEPRTFTGSLP